MFKFTLAKCPINGQERTSSDWWFVLSRHKDIDCAEDALSRIADYKKEHCEYRIFKLKGYAAGEQFNIRTIHDDR